MKRALLITRPKYDDTTHYLFYWAGKVKETAEEKGVQVFNLDKKRASRKEVESILDKQKPSLVFFNGHGNSDLITGQDGEVIIKAGDNEYLLREKIVYAFSCKSARELGLNSVENGVRAYLGYDDDFIFFYDPQKASRPLSDEIAGLFLEPSNQIVVSFLKGHSSIDAHIKTKSLFLRNIQKILTSKPTERYLIPWLLWDMQHSVLVGDKTSRF